MKVLCAVQGKLRDLDREFLLKPDADLYASDIIHLREIMGPASQPDNADFDAIEGSEHKTIKLCDSAGDAASFVII